MKPNIIKYPRTYHLPWSEGTADDKTLESDDNFKGKLVVATIKMDGENFTGYNGYCHARSLDSNNHPSRNKAKDIWYAKSYLLPEDIRICCENMYAKHSIHYNALETYLYVLSIWKKDTCLSWIDTLNWCTKLDMVPVPHFFLGTYNKERIIKLYDEYHKFTSDEIEGYVIRLIDEFQYKDFRKSVGKFVEPKFRNKINETNEHWLSKPIIKNNLLT